MIQILLVENHTDYLTTMTQFLVCRGYNVHGAASLERAADIMLTTHIDLGIVDVRMTDNTDERDWSGLKFVEKWHQIGNTPFIVLSTYKPDFEHVRQILRTRPGRRVPAVNYLLKQEGLSALEKAISEIVYPSKAELFEVLINYFNLQELRELCSLKLNIDYELIADNNLRSTALNLIDYHERSSNLITLVRAIRIVRPNIDL